MLLNNPATPKNSFSHIWAQLRCNHHRQSYRISLDPMACRSWWISSSDLFGIIFLASSSCRDGLLLKNLAKLSCRATLAAKEPEIIIYSIVSFFYHSQYCYSFYHPDCNYCQDNPGVLHILNSSHWQWQFSLAIFSPCSAVTYPSSLAWVKTTVWLLKAIKFIHWPLALTVTCIPTFYAVSIVAQKNYLFPNLLIPVTARPFEKYFHFSVWMEFCQIVKPDKIMATELFNHWARQSLV